MPKHGVWTAACSQAAAWALKVRIANGDSNQWALGYTYNLSKRTNLYTSYARMKNDAQARLGGAAANGSDPSSFNVGIRHKF